MSKDARAKPPAAAASESEDALAALRKFTSEQPAELLLKLGKSAHVRLYKNSEVWSSGAMEGVHDLYVVTVDETAQPVSFFIRMGFTRSQDLSSGGWEWQVSKYEFVSMPPEELMSMFDPTAL